jgi:trans-aconitate methyltransferase
MPSVKDGWAEVWARRTLDTRLPSTLARLMAADGFDTSYASASEEAWRTFVEESAATLGIAAGDDVYEVGCGAGAFLLPLAERDVRVGGLDASPALVAMAREAMPGGAFEVRSASELDEAPCDVVVSCGVFLYFPDTDYAARVVGAMVRKARRGVAILEVPDLARREGALAMRRGHLGEAEYEARYRGLDHLYFDRAWMRETMERAGLVDVVVRDQSIAGYANGAFRFNAFGRKPGA